MRRIAIVLAAALLLWPGMARAQALRLENFAWYGANGARATLDLALEFQQDGASTRLSADLAGAPWRSLRVDDAAAYSYTAGLGGARCSLESLSRAELDHAFLRTLLAELGADELTAADLGLADAVLRDSGFPGGRLAAFAQGDFASSMAEAATVTPLADGTLSIFGANVNVSRYSVTLSVNTLMKAILRQESGALRSLTDAILAKLCAVRNLPREDYAAFMREVNSGGVFIGECWTDGAQAFHVTGNIFLLLGSDAHTIDLSLYYMARDGEEQATLSLKADSMALGLTGMEAHLFSSEAESAFRALLYANVETEDGGVASAVTSLQLTHAQRETGAECVAKLAHRAPQGAFTYLLDYAQAEGRACLTCKRDDAQVYELYFDVTESETLPDDAQPQAEATEISETEMAASFDGFVGSLCALARSALAGEGEEAP